MDRCITGLYPSSIPGRSRVGCVPGMEERVVVAHSIPFHWYTCTTGINIYRGHTPQELPEVRVEKKDLTSKMKWDIKGY